jgi:hypothetical protein
MRRHISSMSLHGMDNVFSECLDTMMPASSLPTGESASPPRGRLLGCLVGLLVLSGCYCGPTRIDPWAVREGCHRCAHWAHEAVHDYKEGVRIECGNARTAMHGDADLYW